MSRRGSRRWPTAADRGPPPCAPRTRGHPRAAPCRCGPSPGRSPRHRRRRAPPRRPRTPGVDPGHGAGSASDSVMRPTHGPSRLAQIDPTQRSVEATAPARWPGGPSGACRRRNAPRHGRRTSPISAAPTTTPCAAGSTAIARTPREPTGPRGVLRHGVGARRTSNRPPSPTRFHPTLRSRICGWRTTCRARNQRSRASRTRSSTPGRHRRTGSPADRRHRWRPTPSGRAAR